MIENLYIDIDVDNVNLPSPLVEIIPSRILNPIAGIRSTESGSNAQKFAGNDTIQNFDGLANNTPSHVLHISVDTSSVDRNPNIQKPNIQKGVCGTNGDDFLVESHRNA